MLFSGAEQLVRTVDRERDSFDVAILDVSRVERRRRCFGGTQRASRLRALQDGLVRLLRSHFHFDSGFGRQARPVQRVTDRRKLAATKGKRLREAEPSSTQLSDGIVIRTETDFEEARYVTVEDAVAAAEEWMGQTITR